MKQRSEFEKKVKSKEKHIVAEYHTHKITDLQVAQEQLTKVQKRIQNGE